MIIYEFSKVPPVGADYRNSFDAATNACRIALHEWAKEHSDISMLVQVIVADNLVYLAAIGDLAADVQAIIDQTYTPIAPWPGATTNH